MKGVEVVYKVKNLQEMRIVFHGTHQSLRVAREKGIGNNRWPLYVHSKGFNVTWIYGNAKLMKVPSFKNYKELCENR